jgi:hypothetical protein
MLSCGFQLFWPTDSWEEDLKKKYFPLQAHVNTVSPIVAPSDPRGHDFNKIAFVLYQEAFV